VRQTSQSKEWHLSQKLLVKINNNFERFQENAKKCSFPIVNILAASFFSMRAGYQRLRPVLIDLRQENL